MPSPSAVPAELWANLQTDAARFGAVERGQAQQMNLQRSREVGDLNVFNRYDTQLANIQRQNQLRNFEFGQQAVKAGGTSGQYTQMGKLRDLERDRKAQAYSGIGTGLGGAIGGLL